MQMATDPALSEDAELVVKLKSIPESIPMGSCSRDLSSQMGGVG